MELLVNVTELSGNFENTRCKSYYSVNLSTFGTVLSQIISRSVVYVLLLSFGWCVVVMNDFPTFRNCPIKLLLEVPLQDFDVSEI